MLYIVGIGPGHRDYILPKAIEILNKCDFIMGFERVINSLDFLSVKKRVATSLKELIINANSYEDKTIGIVASGDPTFYGITNYISKNYSKSLEIIPGISSFQYLTCKLNKPWNNAYVGSLHGRQDEFIELVKKYNLSIWLTDSENNASKLCTELISHSINCNVIIGENLSYSNEEIWIGTPKVYIKNMKEKNLNNKRNLAIFIVENIN